MAQKAAKATARRNESSLNNLHLISLAFNLFFILYRFIYHYSSVTKASIYCYIIFNTPALGIQLYLESIGRPKDARKAGDDLGSSGMMEMMWDVIYVTWACLTLVAVFGESLWWLWAVIPVYGAYAAYTAATGMRDTLGGLGGAANDMAAPGAGGSKRQAKMEKRTSEGKNVRYR
ncbi:hypothetical protein TWF788_000629 [Orbilia oligospora]|uniref:DUF788 domain protein n=1 Tax=Orbilia oligospora TaxID=2813651 RepID=A0A6G1LV50_ORBOL|nr:hypothetical protein TWF788_000629 [Orbilia oligospora]KAF3200739.1 hypothetical protein TWF679_000644 [Orbilia oligospora]KAF3217905.1 hypothetical protein TWF191_008320 [Orbilia oligospora]KAF3233503.1 hypothetical protein TWF192_002135 [Orbilia oligospora]